MISNQRSVFTSSNLFEKAQYKSQERICGLLDAQELHVG